VIAGLTGGIACGKSTVAGLFESLGTIIIDADQVAREVVMPGEPGLDAIIGEFGHRVLQADGTLDRKGLGTIVFSDEDARLKLNGLLHPLIRDRMEQKKNQALQKNPPLLLLDIPLLLESKNQHPVEAIIVVYVPEPVQLARLMNRDNISANDAMNRIKAQLPIEEKAKLADYVIDNSGTIEETRTQVESLFIKLTQ
jgi:dephospho-CoA kinase